MSPILRAVAQKRAFSVAARIRHVVRSAEPHPFERYPTTTKAAKADWGKQFKRLGDGAMFYFPFMGLVVGWPLIGEYFIDGGV